MPGSDYYLHAKGDYDKTYFEIKDFLSSLGYDYYDFNLCKSDFSFADHYFKDDNHFNQDGVERFSHIFCDFFNGKIPVEDMFYKSYAERTLAQGEKIYGLIYHFSDDKKTLEIEPIKNHVDPKRISYDVYAVVGNEEMLLAKNSVQTTVPLPAGKSGKIRVISYIDGVKQNDCTENFAAF